MILTSRYRSDRKTGLGLLCLMIILLAVLRVSWGASHWDSTYDEYWHLLWSERALLEDNFDREYPNFVSTTPINMLNAASKHLFRNLGVERNESLVHASRIPTFIAYFLILILTFRLGTTLWNRQAGLLAATLTALDANVMTHGGLTTVDTYFSVITLWFVIQCIRFSKSPTLREAALLAIPVGLGFLVKLTTVLLLPVVFLVLVAALWPLGLRELLWRLCAYLFLGIGLVCLIISAGYKFHEVGLQLEELQLVSAFMQELQSSLPWLYLPLPQSFIAGFDQTLLYERVMDWNTVIFDQYLSDGVWYYFSVTWFFKTPIAVLILLASGFYLATSKLVRSISAMRRNGFAWRANPVPNSSTFSFGFLIIAALLLIFFLYFNFVFRTHVGLRYIIMSLPLLYLLASVFLMPALKSARAQLLVAACLLIAVIEHFPYWNNALSFSNAFIYDKKNAFHILTDSNIDWGQNYSPVLSQAASEYPDAHIYPVHILPGLNLLRLNDLAGVFRNFEQHQWVREHLRPARHLQHTHLLYAVSAAQFDEYIHANNVAQPLSESASCTDEIIASVPHVITAQSSRPTSPCFNISEPVSRETMISVSLIAGAGTVGPTVPGSPGSCHGHSLYGDKIAVYVLPAGLSQLCLSSAAPDTQWVIREFEP